MFKAFVPDYYFESFDMASAEFLLGLGMKGIILDVDNTLEPYEHAEPGDHVVKWIMDLRSAGISCAIVSNNNRNRIEVFNQKIGLPFYAKAGKPFPKFLKKAMQDLGTDESNTIMMGDQIFTDVWAAHNAGIKAILVPPIKDKRDLLTRFKRLLEIPFLNKYRNINKEK